jgi:hypothetical protein
MAWLFKEQISVRQTSGILINMNSSENFSPASSYLGHVKNGVVVLDVEVSLNEGQAVRVEPLDQGAKTELTKEPAERVRQLQQLFTEWTVEDGQLPDEEADRLQVELDQTRRLSLRSPNLD